MPMPNDFPDNPVIAVSSAYAHAYYRQALLGPKLYFDEKLACWVLLSADLLEHVFKHPACLVRPANLAVPAALTNRATGQFFAGLMRMNEGAAHQHAKQLTQNCLSALSDAEIRQAAQLACQQIAEELAQQNLSAAQQLNYFIQTHPVYSLANLLAMPKAMRLQLPALIAALVACLSPLSNQAELDAADRAYISLLDLMQELSGDAHAMAFFSDLKQNAAQLAWQDQAAILINLCGWFSQSYDACRGMLAASVLRLQMQPEFLSPLAHHARFRNAFLQEVCRLDSPIQNTRRYTNKEIYLNEQTIPADAQLLLVLAAANLDASNRRLVDQFSPLDQASEIYTFGYGHHHCPGKQLALQFCETALAHLLANYAWQTCTDYVYQKSVNARIALFTSRS